MVPPAVAFLVSSYVDEVVFGDLFQVPIVLHVDIARNLVQLALLSILFDLLPVGLAVAFHWLDPKLPWSADSALRFHTIFGCAIVLLDWGKVAMGAELLESTQASLVLKIEIELDMDSSSLWGFLHLPNNVNGLACRLPFF